MIKCISIEIRPHKMIKLGMLLMDVPSIRGIEHIMHHDKEEIEHNILLKSR